MASRKIMDAIDLATKEKVYYKGHAQAIYMSDGRTVEDAIADVDTKIAEAIGNVINGDY